MDHFRTEDPVFILANPRSGSTLFRLMLAAHPSIVIPPESEFIVKLYPKFGHIESFNIRNATYFLQVLKFFQGKLCIF